MHDAISCGMEIRLAAHSHLIQECARLALRLPTETPAAANTLLSGVSQNIWA
ncbi:MAG: hypothetical protein ACYYK0_02010 [Candidatus Eutrophobiaceae bacterium]